MDSKKILTDIFKPIFKKYGFKKKGSSWYLINQEIIGIFNIQKSQWSDACYLNIALYIRKDEPIDYLPNYSLGHIQFRGGEGIDNKELQEILLFETEITPLKKEILEKLLEEKIIPIFIKNTSKKLLIDSIKNNEEYFWKQFHYDGKVRLQS